MSQIGSERRARDQAAARTDGPANDELASVGSHTLAMLDAALATELTGMLQCRRHHFLADGTQSRTMAVMFLVHSVQAQRNADALAGRIVQLGGAPDFSPGSLARRSHVPYLDGTTPDTMVGASLSAERAANQCYRWFIELLQDTDPRTSHLLRSILSAGAAYIGELESALDQTGPTHSTS